MYFVTENCINISGIIDDNKIAQELNDLAIIRSKTLDICYSIPHYDKLEIETKKCYLRYCKKVIDILNRLWYYVYVR